MLWKDYITAFPSSHGKTDFAEFMGEPISEKERTLKLIRKKEWVDQVKNLSDEYRDEVISDCVKLINIGYPKEVVPNLALSNPNVAKSFISKYGIYDSINTLPMHVFLEAMSDLAEKDTNVLHLTYLLENIEWFPNECKKEIKQVFARYSEVFGDNEIQQFIQNNYYSNPIALRMMLLKEDLSQESFYAISQAKTFSRDNALVADIANHKLADAPYLINLFKSKYGTSMDMQKAMLERLVNEFDMNKPQVVEAVTQAILSDGIDRNWSVQEQYQKLVDEVELYEDEQGMSLSR